MKRDQTKVADSAIGRSRHRLSYAECCSLVTAINASGPQPLRSSEFSKDVLGSIVETLLFSGNAQDQQQGLSALKTVRSKKITRSILQRYHHLEIETKELCLELFHSLFDHRCKSLLRSQCTDLRLNRFARCYAYETLGWLLAKSRSFGELMDLIEQGLSQEHHIQIAALCISCYVPEKYFPLAILRRMSTVNAIVAEVQTNSHGWLGERILAHRPS